MATLASALALAVLLTLFGGQGAAGEPMPGVRPLDDQTLAGLVGGLRAGGLDIDIGIDLRTRFADQADPNTADPIAYETRLTMPAGGPLVLSRAGQPLTGAEVARAGLATRIDNSVDSRSIEHTVRLDVVVTRLAQATRQMAITRVRPGGATGSFR